MINPEATYNWTSKHTSSSVLNVHSDGGHICINKTVMKERERKSLLLVHEYTQGGATIRPVCNPSGKQTSEICVSDLSRTVLFRFLMGWGWGSRRNGENTDSRIA